jgi:hypothetical protein
MTDSRRRIITGSVEDLDYRPELVEGRVFSVEDICVYIYARAHSIIVMAHLLVYQYLSRCYCSTRCTRE